MRGFSWHGHANPGGGPKGSSSYWTTASRFRFLIVATSPSFLNCFILLALLYCGFSSKHSLLYLLYPSGARPGTSTPSTAVS
ncbi:unnamed protein product [Prunus armeniaca]